MTTTVNRADPLRDPARMAREIGTAIMPQFLELARAIQHLVRRHAPYAFGHFLESITLDPITQNGLMLRTRVFSTSPEVLTRTLEGGRRRGAPAPPKGDPNLLAWMELKGIPLEAEDKIRWAIKYHGFKYAPEGFRMFEKAELEARPLVAALPGAWAAVVVGSLNRAQ